MQKKRILLYCIAFVLIAVLLFSAFKILKRYYDYENAKEYYDNKQKQYVTQVVDENVANDETEKTSLPIKVDFSGLISENSDIVGWIYSPDTPINYPVVQSNNNSKYLNIGLDGKYLINGTNFVDFRNYEIGIDENYIIYGHNMRNKTMFGTIDDYRSQSYYDSHPSLYFLTPDRNYRIDLIAGKQVLYNDFIYQTAPISDEFHSHVKNIIKNSLFKSNVEYTSGDKIITLSTCTDNSGKYRFIVIGKFVEI